MYMCKLVPQKSGCAKTQPDQPLDTAMLYVQSAKDGTQGLLALC